MELPMAPEVLLKETYNYILEHPEEHDQAWWASKNSCGTSYCFAGHAVVLAGYTINWGGTYGGIGRSSFVNLPGVGNFDSISAVAKRLLELNDDQADLLFAGGNTIGDIRDILEDWKVL